MDETELHLSMIPPCYIQVSMQISMTNRYPPFCFSTLHDIVHPPIGDYYTLLSESRPR